VKFLLVEMKVGQSLGAFRVVPGIGEQHSADIPKEGANGRQEKFLRKKLVEVDFGSNSLSRTDDRARSTPSVDEMKLRSESNFSAEMKMRNSAKERANERVVASACYQCGFGTEEGGPGMGEVTSLTFADSLGCRRRRRPEKGLTNPLGLQGRIQFDREFQNALRVRLLRQLFGDLPPWAVHAIRFRHHYFLLRPIVIIPHGGNLQMRQCAPIGGRKILLASRLTRA
jgi:hypothetical protein